MLDTIFEIIQNAISTRETFFLSEEEIQLFLAREIELSDNGFNVFLEYSVDVEHLENFPWEGKRISIDIVVEKDGRYVPIEIKFKTKKQKTENNLFGEENTEVELLNQSAVNNACYDFWKDVKRIELINNRFGNNVGGIALFVTNHSLYWRGPNSEPIYYKFRIKDSRKIRKDTILSWKEGGNHKKRSPQIVLQGDYELNWKTDINIEKHGFLMLKI